MAKSVARRRELTAKFLYPLFVFFFFLEPHLQHMEVPRLRVKLELHLLAYATATADPRHICDLQLILQQ